MITTFFSKSKPINLVIVSVFIVILFVISNFNGLFTDIGSVLKAVGKLLVVLFMVFLLDFIVAKNNLTKQNSFAIMTLALLFAVFPQAMIHSDLLLSNLFVMFSLRRIISLQSHINIKKKLFDAAFWIGCAMLFEFWSFLFFALVIVALIYHAQNDIKNTLIPFVGLATVAILLMAYNIVVYDVFIKPSNFPRYASLDFTAYNSKESILKLTVLFTSLVWIVVHYFKIISGLKKKQAPSFFLIAWTSIIAVLIAIIAPVKNGSEFIFLFVPFSIIMSKYIETISERWFREVFITLLIITPIISLLL